MKVLKVVAIVLGVLLLLGGGGLLAGAALVDKGQSTIEDKVRETGFEGPVDGKVTEVDPATSMITVSYVDKGGQPHVASGPTTTATPQVGDVVPVYYSIDDPTQVFIAQIPGGQLGSLASTLKTAGIVCLVAGAVLLLGGILGLVLGRKNPTAVPSVSPPALPPHPAAPSWGAAPPGPGGPPPGQPYPPAAAGSYPSYPPAAPGPYPSYPPAGPRTYQPGTGYSPIPGAPPVPGSGPPPQTGPAAPPSWPPAPPRT